jgi:hypothetical protein
MSMCRRTILAWVLLGIPGIAVSASADSTTSGDAVRLLEQMPARGSTKASVRAKLGDPDRVVGAVGEPPITRWVYDEFTVYFEHNRVLHSVENPAQ